MNEQNGGTIMTTEEMLKLQDTTGITVTRPNVGNYKITWPENNI